LFFFIFLGFELLVFLLIIIFILNQKLLSQQIGLVLVLTATLFVSHKQAFTAIHVLNIMGAFYFYPALFFLMMVYAPKVKWENIRLVILVFALKVITINIIRANEHNLKNYLISTLPHAIQANTSLEGVLHYLNPTRFLSDIFTYQNQLHQTTTKAQATSINLHKQYGWTSSTSFDIMPTEISSLFFDGLKYNPRPVIQS
jgi:hypothetical protein